MHLDPSSAALYAIVAIVLVLTGAILTAGPVTTEQRGAVLTAGVAILAAIGWRIHRRDTHGD